MEEFVKSLEKSDVIYHKIRKLYGRLLECHRKYKQSTTPTAYSNICVECTKIEHELDKLELYKITENRVGLYKLRKLMLVRLWELETKAKKNYLIVK